MSTSKHIDRLCAIAVVVALLISVLLTNGEALGIQAQAKTMGYENRLFDTTRVHTIDIRIDDWDAFLQTAQSEEYSVCSVVIDGEAFKNVGIRGKGNTSLSTVASMDSERYSFKIEFDQYDSTKSYYGLDKLSLNNLIQDNTMMKDYLTYQMMNAFGVAAPLSSFVYITVNGEDWGLYLAVEAVEESFLQRNYGSSYGDLYKPDSMNMGGGRGNGKDFSFEDFTEFSESADASAMPDTQTTDTQTQQQKPGSGGKGNHSQMGGFGFSMDEEALRNAFEELNIDTALLDGIDFDNITMESIQSVLSALDMDTMQKLMEKVMDSSSFGDMGGFGMGSDETKLQYIDDDPDSYSTIFSSAKTDVTEVDQIRLISALKDLSEGKDSAVDVEAVIRYFVVHNFVVNGDSYTGSMVHNYYLYEEDGQLSMIPWDYNLAFGTFQGSNAASAVNDDIDAPLSVTGSGRPMIDWIFSSEEYTNLYHQYFQGFLDTVDAQSIISQAKELISDYVEKDPTKFCTYEEFETGVEALATFCDLRTQSVRLQLAGEEADVDASSLTLSDMGTMNNGFGGGGKGDLPGMSGGNSESTGQQSQFPTMPDSSSGGSNNQMPQMSGGNGQMPQMSGGQGGMQMPEQGEMPQMPGQSGMSVPTSGTDSTTGEAEQLPGFGNSDSMIFPEGMEDFFSGNEDSGKSSFPGGWQTGMENTQSSNAWPLLLVSVLFLAAGLLFVWKFKR